LASQFGGFLLAVFDGPQEATTMRWMIPDTKLLFDQHLYWLLGTSVRKIDNFAYPTYLCPWHGTRLRKKRECVHLTAAEKMSPSYEKNRRLLVAHTQGNHAVDAR
jgi:hypothetical protein